MSVETIKSERARADYMAMGVARSLKKLAGSYAEDPDVRGGSRASLERWSARDGWRAKAAAHDARVAGKAVVR